jgi:trans-aconitate methyltransferase
MDDRATQWDTTYTDRGDTSVSWFQAVPTPSLHMIDVLGIAPTARVIDVGGGAAALVDHLMTLGFTDLTVLDISVVALTAARARVGEQAPVSWVQEDVLAWRPLHRFDLCHDRAVFHFLVDPADQQRYLATLRAVLAPAGAVIIATFAPDGPDHCSGLPVARYSAEDLTALLGDAFTVVETFREEHTTPTGARQPFTWIAARRAS